MSLTAVFIASLLGSLHCVGMCGGFVALCTGGKSCFRTHGVYNFGRFTSYIFLGGLAGTIGKFGNKVSAGVGISHGATIILGLLVIFWGLSSLFLNYNLFSKISLPISKSLEIFYQKVMSLLPKDLNQKAFCIGLFSAFLPCGWLYAYVAIAATTSSTVQGMAVMAAFWLGTVPALLGVGWITSHLSDSLRKRLPVLTAVILIAAGIFAITEHLAIIDNTHHHCHVD